jgi:hypothetical protein
MEPESKMTQQPDEAQKVLRELETKCADARARHDETTAAAKEIAFSAHTGDDAARKRLDQLHTDIAKIGAEVSSLEAALIEARRRCAVAMAAEGDKAERARAERALSLLDDFTERGAALDTALAGFVAEYTLLVADFHKLDALGFAPTTHALIETNMRRATATALMFTGLRQDFLAPHERRSFVDVIAGWAPNVRGRAVARLNKDTARAA